MIKGGTKEQVLKEDSLVCEKSFRDIRIYWDGLLFLHIKTDNYDALQSWVQTAGTKYCIEIYRKIGDPILIEVDEYWKWKRILTLLNQNL